jgi:hypothetical protein
MTKFMQKSFSVYSNYNSQPKCLCGKEIKVGYSTQEGYLCSECYSARKAKKAEEKLQAVIKENNQSL